ncbi:pyridoxamine 5'-phosphate oxidase-domain-containing protein [Zopfochytrium polystomum]|nr:pyridoxamine 5'-phosphate oxidase-domain-containing protein [Zopfochytrium polystomum]
MATLLLLLFRTRRRHRRRRTRTPPGTPAVLASSQSSISSSSTTTLLHEEPAAIAADAPTTPAAAAPVAQFPPWRVPLEEALAANERADSAHLYASLATIKPFGRPANRTVFFRGFLSDLDGDFDTSYKQHHLGALSNVIMFATDIRSGSVEDLVHGSKFGEVCWFLPNTREQFRLSGQLHLVVSPTHSLSTAHRIPAAPFSSSARFPPLHPDWWEQRRLDVWRHLSSVRRASFSWPKSHTHLVAATTSTASAAPFGAAAPPPAVATASGGADNAAPAPPRIVERGLASEVVAAQRTAVVTHLGADEASAPIAPAATTAAAADSTAAGSPGTVGPAPAAPSVTRASAESLEVDPSPVPAAATGDSQQAQSSSDSSGSSSSSSSLPVPCRQWSAASGRRR